MALSLEQTLNQLSERDYVSIREQIGDNEPHDVNFSKAFATRMLNKHWHTLPEESKGTLEDALASIYEKEMARVTNPGQDRITAWNALQQGDKGRGG
jgi:hypothetical protein